MLLLRLPRSSRSIRRLPCHRLYSEDTAKQDIFVGGVAKKIEKTYYEMWRAEAQEAAAAKEREAARAGHSSAASSAASRPEEKAPELRIGDTNSQS